MNQNIKDSEITVGYWSTKALGSSIRMLVIYSQRPLKAKLYKLNVFLENNHIFYDGSAWHDNDKIKLKKKNILINLPYVEMHDNNNNKVLISQSLVCLSFLGRQLNMFGKSDFEKLYCEQFLHETNDLRSLISKFSYTHFVNNEQKNNEAKEIMKKLVDKSSGKLQKFEDWIQQNKKKNSNLFLVGDSISAADFNFFDILDFYIEFIKYFNFIESPDADIFKNLGFPNTCNFYNEFKKLPKLEKYFNSQLYELPFQNKSALFGSKNIFKKWDHVNEFDNFPDEIFIK